MNLRFVEAFYWVRSQKRHARTFGNPRYQYYETLSGAVLDAQGRPADGFDGASMVQTHMTNSRLAAPEVLELRFPARLKSYEIGHGSGGQGRWRGGGGVRRIRFLEQMPASILSNGRRQDALGMAGGQPGAVGLNRVVRQDERVETLGYIGQTEMGPDDLFEIHIPGSGYGTAK